MNMNSFCRGTVSTARGDTGASYSCSQSAAAVSCARASNAAGRVSRDENNFRSG